MLAILCFMAALFGLIDLFSDPPDRVLPWWGDTVVLIAAAAVYLANRWLFPEDN